MFQEFASTYRRISYHNYVNHIFSSHTSREQRDGLLLQSLVLRKCKTFRGVFYRYSSKKVPFSATDKSGLSSSTTGILQKNIRFKKGGILCKAHSNLDCGNVSTETDEFRISGLLLLTAIMVLRLYPCSFVQSLTHPLEICENPFVRL